MSVWTDDGKDWLLKSCRLVEGILDPATGDDPSPDYVKSIAAAGVALNGVYYRRDGRVHKFVVLVHDLDQEGFEKVCRAELDLQKKFQRLSFNFEVKNSDSFSNEERGMLKLAGYEHVEEVEV